MNPTGQKIIIEIRPSRWLELFLFSTHLSALILIASYAALFPECLVLVPALFWSWIRNRSMHATLNGRNAVGSVEWGADGGWSLIDREGGRTSARLLERNFVSPWMTLLSFSCQTGFRRHVILLVDNSDADQVRRLRVRLRLSRESSTHYSSSANSASKLSGNNTVGRL